jgi:cold shock CspA family protein
MISSGKIAVLSRAGYGFIRPDHENSTHVFFHRSDVQDCSFDHDLRIGLRVEFARGFDASSRPQAYVVRPVKDAPVPPDSRPT